MTVVGNIKGPTGPAGPSFSAGGYTSRPSAGTANRLYYATDIGVLYRDTGSAWSVVSVDEMTPANLVGNSSVVATTTLATITIPSTALYPRGSVTFRSSGLLGYPSNATLTLSIAQNGTALASCTWTAGNQAQTNRYYQFWCSLAFNSLNNNISSNVMGVIQLASTPTISAAANVNSGGIGGAAGDVFTLRIGTSSTSSWGITPLESWAELVNPVA